VIPFAQGKQIISATLVVIATEDSGGDEADIKTGCEAADNSSTPGSGAALRAKTMTAATLTVSQSAVTQGNSYTFDLTAAVQEILNRAGWVAGNTLGVLVWDVVQGNTGNRRYAATEHATYNGPQLQIVVASLFVPRAGAMI
jgi:hypothetical protein